MRISLIGTYHEECGAVTVSALTEILEEVEPEVIFAEIPPTHLRAWIDGSHGTVESLAAARYAEAHSLEVVPVDLPKPDASFFRDYEEVSRVIGRTSPTFQRLVDLNTDRTRRYGFPYLNSNACIRAWTEIHHEELETIEYIRHPGLSDTYTRVRDMMERRDLEMLRNIRAYCASAAHTRGAFLFGAAHRKSLIQKISAAGETAPPRIEWDMSGSQADFR